MFKRNLLIWVAIILGAVAISEFVIRKNPDIIKKEPTKTELVFSDFLNNVKNKKVKSVIIDDTNKAVGELVDGTKFETKLASYPKIYELLDQNKVNVEIKDSKTGVGHFLLNIFPTLLWVFVLILIIRSFRNSMTKGGGGANPFTFGDAKAKALPKDQMKITFDDVAGIDQAKKDVEEIVEFLKNPKKFSDLGGRIPKGVLLTGNPGTGKTLLAKAIAGEADVPFFSMSGSDFVEMFVGVGASRVRDLFETGKKNAPCIIFIDEIDAVGRHRGAGYGGGNDEREQTLNQLLVELDGFGTNEGIILIAATNRADVLDKALLRPGRFDRQIYVPLPDVKGREEILKIHVKKIKASNDIDLSVIARGTVGFSGADLANLANEAALIAARKKHEEVKNSDFEDAKDKILMGSERTLIMDEKDIKNTAYHEAGHAFLGTILEDATPVHKATIIPRGNSLGSTHTLPEKDEVSQNLKQIKATLAMLCGGRIAEEEFFGLDNVTTGAAGDIAMATNLARRVITVGGLSKKLGFLSYRESDKYATKSISNETALLVDQEVRKLIDESYKTAQTLIKKNKAKVKNLAENLIKYETLTGDEIKQIIAGKKLDKKV
ncbi:MAG: ATP-dependent zinc metalloprotease FtsH, partial [Rickettsiales bacterium]|nr:ATP-dependent zinc metalloprotease FtsH [Rickettsiales bacterium]